MDIARKLNISQELSAFEKYHIYDKSKVRYVSKYDEFEAQSVEHSDYARNLSAIWRIWLYAKYHAITSQTGWISVKDKLPEKDGNYITYQVRHLWGNHYEKEVTQARYHVETGFGIAQGVTHWQPLPEPPQDSK